MRSLTRKEWEELILTTLVFAIFFGAAAFAPGGLPR